MKKTVPKHDLDALCAACNMTVAQLSEETGIPEDELRSYADGVVPLPGRDRCAILEALTTHSPIERRTRSVVQQLQTRLAIGSLMREVMEEDEEADRELERFCRMEDAVTWLDQAIRARYLGSVLLRRDPHGCTWRIPRVNGHLVAGVALTDEGWCHLRVGDDDISHEVPDLAVPFGDGDDDVSTVDHDDTPTLDAALFEFLDPLLATDENIDHALWRMA